MSHRDFYKILNVSNSASDDEIKRAYRILAKKYHPDRNPDDPKAEEQFKEVQQAYDALRDPKNRAQYDQYGEVGVGQWATNPSGKKVYKWGGSGSTVGIDDLEDLFSAFGSGSQRSSIFDDILGGAFGGQRVRHAVAPQRGQDQQQSIELTFEQAIRGTTLTLQLKMGQNGPPETIEVKIPPGVSQGQKIRIAGRVPGFRGGPAGDLYLICSIKQHAYFTREGMDLYIDVPVSITEAVLGGKIEVPTLDGKVTMTLPPGTLSGTRLRLKGKGVQKKGNAQGGDLFVVVKIVPPDELTDEQRKLFEQLMISDLSDPRAKCPW